ncbi:MAG: response regulator [Acidobacteria bacterium]|nr:response regulator [Acidobacteriota bacterium]
MTKVLLVEDEANSREVYSCLLELDGHEVVAVETAPAAMAAIERERFDVALIDVALGTQDGFSVLAHLRRHQPAVRAIIMTAYDLPDASRRAQADAFLAKPLQWSDVRAAIAHRPSERRAS